MKSRQKFTVPGKNISKRFDSETDNSLENRVKKKIASNPLIQKNINFLQTYNNLFRKPLSNFGDADSYFKKSLRSNEALDIIRDLKLQSLFVKSAKSYDSISKRKPRSKQTLLSPRLPNRHSISNLNCASVAAKNEELFVKELFSSKSKEDSESEGEESKVDSSRNQFLSELEEVEEVSDESPTPKVQGGLNKRLDDILESEKDDTSGSEAVMEGEDEQQAEGFEEDVDVGDGGVQEAPEEGAVQEDVGEEEAGEEGADVAYPEREEFGERDVGAEEDEVANEEDEEIAEVGRMIEQASEELQQVVEENQEMMNNLQAQEAPPQEAAKDDGKGDGSYFQFNPKIHAAIVKELEDAERQAKETAAIIHELKTRVAQLLQKDQMTEADARELEQKNKELEAQMVLFEEKTKKIQQLVNQTNLFEDMAPVRPVIQRKNKEDMLPKVVVCGLGEDDMPKFIVCDKKKKTPKYKQAAPSAAPAVAQLDQRMAKRLNECYCMQEKLAAENADLERKRYKLQSDLINKDQTVECLQKQLANLQNEMRMVCKENKLLNRKLQGGMEAAPTCTPASRPCSPSGRKKLPCGKCKKICSLNEEARLDEYCKNAEILEKQLVDMEGELKNMQEELLAVRKEREHLEHHRKMLCGPPPCYPPPPPPCSPHPCIPPPCSPHPCLPPPCSPHPCMPPSPCECGQGSSEQHLKQLREQYNRLQDDFKGKLTEVAGLRTDNEKLKDTAKSAEEAKKAAETKMKELEAELKKFKGNKKSGGKEQLIELEQQLTVAKQRFREAQDELEEVRALVLDQEGQLESYRNKYLEAEQKVEEQRRTIDMMEMENQRISEQVNLEIQRVKNQFQEKLTELMPLPDILKSTQMKLQEAQQMHLLAERNNEAIARELQQYKDKVAALTDQMNLARSGSLTNADEKETLKAKVKEMEMLLNDLQEENDKLKRDKEGLLEKCDELQRLTEERAHEITQLESQLENVREETARQVARTKDRCEIVRRSMQNQISELERQLAQSRALAKTAQKDRDDIRQKMQAQINNLNENFEDAQMRIRNLQGHVNFLKNTYGNVFPSGEDHRPKELPEPCNCGAEY